MDGANPITNSVAWLIKVPLLHTLLPLSSIPEFLQLKQIYSKSPILIVELVAVGSRTGFLYLSSLASNIVCLFLLVQTSTPERYYEHFSNKQPATTILGLPQNTRHWKHIFCCCCLFEKGFHCVAQAGLNL